MNDGFVRLIDSMPSDHGSGDGAIVQAARVSYGDGTKTTSTDRGLLRYLMRHWHTTPFEMVEFKFHIKMPIFVARQHLRHRTASVNEISGRYSVLPREFWVAETLRGQSETNRQGSSGEISLDSSLQRESCEKAFGIYTDLLSEGCSRELARCHLPMNTYTEFYWKINLHNLLHYLRLRMDSHAQPEIQAYAVEIFNLIQPIVPVTVEAFKDFRLNAVSLTGPELEWLGGDRKTEPELPTKRETTEFIEKIKKYNLVPHTSILKQWRQYYTNEIN